MLSRLASMATFTVADVTKRRNIKEVESVYEPHRFESFSKFAKDSYQRNSGRCDCTTVFVRESSLPKSIARQEEEEEIIEVATNIHTVSEPTNRNEDNDNDNDDDDRVLLCYTCKGKQGRSFGESESVDFVVPPNSFGVFSVRKPCQILPLLAFESKSAQEHPHRVSAIQDKLERELSNRLMTEEDQLRRRGGELFFNRCGWEKSPALRCNV